MFGNRKKTTGTKPSKVYRDLCTAFDSENINYNSDEEHFAVYGTFIGDDLPIKLSVNIDTEMPIMCFDALLDFLVPSGSENAVISGLNEINSTLHFGAFVFSSDERRVIYRYHHLFAEYVPSKECIISITKMVIETVDANDGNLKKLIPEQTTFSDPMFN